MQAANLSEIFASIEGEGINAGRPAVFIRLAGCNLSCSFCDTRYAREASETASIHAGGETSEIANPVSCDEIISLVTTGFDHTESVVLTGGEPLVQAPAVRYLAAGLRARGCSVQLETNGSLPDEFLTVRDTVDFVSMDIKLPSTQQGKSLEADHRVFLRALRGLRAAVKIVITPEVTDAEIVAAADLVAGVNPYVPVFLQPAFSDSRPCVDAQKVLGLRDAMAGRLRDVRISIQLHKILGIR
jgi:organic radical activating enzyme